jgi:hypothetical protein
MAFAAASVPAPADDFSFFNNQSSHHRVGACPAPSACSQLQGHFHKIFVCHDGLLTQGRGQCKVNYFMKYFRFKKPAWRIFACPKGVF